MRRASPLIAFALVWVTTLPAAGQQIFGSGSTFVYPILARWSGAYQQLTGTRVAYQPIGSSGGITEIRAGIVDFGVSDAPLVSDQLLRDGLAQFPVVMGAIVPVVNLAGIAAGQIRFTGQLLADIYLGKIKNWNDPAIAAVNPDMRLPNQTILVVHRSDGSGTTFNWADYLSKVSPEWKVRVGAGPTVAWPTGVGGKGNVGVADSVARVKGAIGYVEYGYAARKGLAYGLVQNHAGNFVQPDTSSFQAATEDLDWAKVRGFYVSLTDAPRADAYPIMAASFVLIHKYAGDIERSRRVLAFFRWALKNQQDVAASLGYLPLPSSLVRQVEEYWNAEWDPAAKGSAPATEHAQNPG